jgi:hypothetical protein
MGVDKENDMTDATYGPTAPQNDAANLDDFAEQARHEGFADVGEYREYLDHRAKVDAERDMMAADWAEMNRCADCGGCVVCEIPFA